MRHLLPILLASAALSHAQTASIKVTSPDHYSVSLDKFEVVRSGDDFDALALGAKVGVGDDLRLALSYAGASSDPFDLTGATNVEVEATRISFGAEYDLAAAGGDFTLSLAYARTSGETEGGFVGDAFENSQVVLGARYGRELGAGFSVAVSAHHFINDLEVESGFAPGDVPAAAALLSRYEDSTTSLGLSLLYSPTRRLSFHLTYATEDALLGLANADNTISFGVKASF